MDEQTELLLKEGGKTALTFIPGVGLCMWLKDFNNIPQNERGFSFWLDGAAGLISCVPVVGGACGSLMKGSVVAVKIANGVTTGARVAEAGIYTTQAVVLGDEMLNPENGQKASVPQESQEMLERRGKQKEHDERIAIARREKESNQSGEQRDSSAGALIGMLVLATAGMAVSKEKTQSYNQRAGNGNPALDFEVAGSKQITVV
jgi:hypothetical protein